MEELFELCFQAPTHTELEPQSCPLYPLPGGEETLDLNPLWTPFLLGVHHRVVQHQGQSDVMTDSAAACHEVLV